MSIDVTRFEILGTNHHWNTNIITTYLPLQRGQTNDFALEGKTLISMSGIAFIQ